MANSIDIGINFVEPNDDGKKRDTEPQSDKPKKTSSKGKSSTGPSDTQLTQDQLNRIKELEAKYSKGKIKGPEVAEYLKLANVKVGEELKELLSKETTYAGGKEVLKGKPLSLVVERRGHPNEKKNRLKAQMTKAMDKAAKNILSQVVATQPSPDIVADVTNQAIEQIAEEKAIEEAVIQKQESVVDYANKFVKTYNNLRSQPHEPSPFINKSPISWEGNTYPTKERASYGGMHLNDYLEKQGYQKGDSFVWSPTTSRNIQVKDRLHFNMHESPEAIEALNNFVKSKGGYFKIPTSSNEWATRTDPAVAYFPNELTDADYKEAAISVGKYLRGAYSPEKLVGKEVHPGIASVSEPTHEEIKKLVQDIQNPNLRSALHSKLWSQEGNRPTSGKYRASAGEFHVAKQMVEQFDKSSQPEPTTASSKIPPSKKTASNKPKDIFSYATEENAQQYEEQESKRKQEQASKQKEAEDKARKMVEDAIMPVEDSLKDIADAVSKLGTGAGSGDGGKGKGPKAPPGFGDDDGMGDDGDIGDGFDPFPTLRARIENLQRTFKSTLYAEKDANLFSSLQKTFEKGRRAEDLDIVQKNVEEEVRAQMKLLLAFETRNENLRNSLEATLIEKIRKEIDKPQEKQNRPAFEWLVSKLKEVQESREKIKSEFDKIETEITSTISERATSGFVQGKIERDIRQMEVQGKEEDKIIDTYMKEFSKYVKAEYKQIAKKQAFEVGRQTMEANKDKMKSSELLKKMKVAYDKEFTRVMDTIPTETELTREEILAAHEAGQGKFAPETFRPKGASPEYTARQPSTTGGSGGTGGPGTPTATAGEPEDIPPSRENLSAILPPPKVDMDKVRENFARWALIKEATKPMVSASTPQGTTGSEVFGTAAAVGGGALALGVLAGTISAPMAGVAVGITQMTGILAQIAENTAKEVTPFSPELIMAKVEQSLDRLSMNISISNRYGKDLANYQRSSNSMSNQLYGLGVDIWNVIDTYVIALVDLATIALVLLRGIIQIGNVISSILEIAMYPSLTRIAKAGESIFNLFFGGNTAKIKDYTEDFMANDLRPRNNNRNP